MRNIFSVIQTHRLWSGMNTMIQSENCFSPCSSNCKTLFLSKTLLHIHNYVSHSRFLIHSESFTIGGKQKALLCNNALTVVVRRQSAWFASTQPWINWQRHLSSSPVVGTSLVKLVMFGFTLLMQFSWSDIIIIEALHCVYFYIVRLRAMHQ